MAETDSSTVTDSNLNVSIVFAAISVYTALRSVSFTSHILYPPWVDVDDDKAVLVPRLLASFVEDLIRNHPLLAKSGDVIVRL